MGSSMEWTGSNRKDRLPSNWIAVRTRILRRDRYTCTKCGKPANQVDHIAAGDNHADWNLTSLPNHQQKAGAQYTKADANEAQNHGENHQNTPDYYKSALTRQNRGGGNPCPPPSCPLRD